MYKENKFNICLLLSGELILGISYKNKKRQISNTAFPILLFCTIHNFLCNPEMGINKGYIFLSESNHGWI